MRFLNAFLVGLLRRINETAPILINMRCRDTQISNQVLPAELFAEDAMRAQSAALGIAAAAAFSSAASALPCAETSLGKPPTSELTCTVTDKTSGLSPREQQGDPGANGPQDDSQPPTGQSALFLDITEAADAETFAGGGIKITNLQATMTSNKYIAGRLPTAAEKTRVEDLIMLSPDYLSTKMLPRIPKRNPVGVGLVTVPKPPVKESDTTPPGQWFPQPKR